MQPTREFNEESPEDYRQEYVDLSMKLIKQNKRIERLENLEKYSNPSYVEVISVDDTAKDIGNHMLEAFEKFPTCTRFRLNFAQNKTFFWDVRSKIPPCVHMTLSFYYVNGAKDLSTTVKMTEKGTKIVTDKSYPGVYFRKPARCLISGKSTLEIFGMNLIQTGYGERNDSTEITRSSYYAGIFSIVGEYGYVKFVESRAKINEKYFVNAPYYHFGRTVFGYTWITNTGTRKSFATATYRGHNKRGSYMIISASHTYLEKMKIVDPKNKESCKIISFT